MDRSAVAAIEFRDGRRDRPVPPGQSRNALRVDLSETQPSQTQRTASGPLQCHRIEHGGSRRNPCRFAPAFFLDGPAFDEIPLDRLYGPGVVWHLPCAPDEVIQVATLERARPQL